MPQKSRGILHGKGQTTKIEVGNNVTQYKSYFEGLQRTGSSVTPLAWKQRIRLGMNASKAFTSYKVHFKQSQGAYVECDASSAITRKWEGYVFAKFRERILGPADFVAPSSDIPLYAAGTTLMSRALPTNPLSGLAVFLGELRDPLTAPTKTINRAYQKGKHDFQKRTGKPANHLPANKGRRTPPENWEARAYDFYQSSKDTAKDYLAVEFGWNPFVRDIADFISVTALLENRISQFEKNSGKSIRRKRSRTVYDIETAPPPSSSYGTPVSVSQFYNSPGLLHEHTRVTRNQWFVGCFTYYLPPANGNFLQRMKRREMILNHLYGTRVTPSTLWQLAPWSWALDWKSNVGDVIRNWSAFTNDGLVLKYGDVMETTSKTTTWSLSNLKFKNSPPVFTTQTIESVTKIRRRATPYGFGLDENDFSDRQKSIIAALGISRV